MQKEKHRVVIDTNLWVSFLLTKDYSKLDRIMSADTTTLLLSQELWEEIVEVAERPKFRKYFDLSELTDLLFYLKQQAEMVPVITWSNMCRDDKDNVLLSLSIDGAATHILTGDKDLLVLNPFGEVQMLTVADYLFDK